MKDYYKILGISPDASEKRLKEAYRKMVLKHHPDRCTDGDSRRFLEIQEAYETLRDPEKRKQYDEERGRVEQHRAKVSPEKGFVATLKAQFRGYETPYTEDRGFLGLDDWFFHIPTNANLDLDLLLDRDEAYYGGMLPINLPVAEKCPKCRGTGEILGRGVCSYCMGEGTVVREKPVRILIPPQVEDQTVYQVSLAPLGFPHRYLLLHISIVS